MLNIYKSLKWFFKKRIQSIILILLSIILISIITPLPAKYIGIAIDDVSNGSIDRDKIIAYFFNIFLAPIILYFLNFVYKYLLAKNSVLLSRELNIKYISHLFELDSEVFGEYTKGDLVLRANDDLKSITEFSIQMLPNLLYSIFIIISIIVSILQLNYTISVLIIILFVVTLTIISILRAKMKKLYKENRMIISNLTEGLLESIEGVKTIRAHVQEENDKKKLEGLADDALDIRKKIIVRESFFAPLFEVLQKVSVAIVFILGTYLMFRQEATLSSILSLYIYIGMLIYPCLTLSNIFLNANTAVVSYERFNEILSLESRIINKEKYEINKFKIISFKDFSFAYPKDKQDTLNSLNFTIKSGDTIGIVGETGSGKSTLILQFLREFNIAKGQILIDDVPIESYDYKSIRNLIGLVPQSYVLFKRDIKGNLIIGKVDASDNEINQAIKIACFEQDLEFLNQGLNTEVSEFGTTLSGGQKQRLSIARALLKDPEILILDDSLSAVDTKTEQKIIKNLKKYRKDKTNIIIAHRLTGVEHADLILVIADGKIAEMGNHNKLMENKGWYYRQFIRQNLEKE